VNWRFWIDVGGTFTDCVAQSPAGELHTWKTLSSGVINGSGFVDASRRQLRDESRAKESVDFWVGWTVTIGEWTGTVVQSDGGQLTLNAAVPGSVAEVSYQLSCHLEAPVVCIRQVLGLRMDEPLPVVDVRLGTTRGTNALLERKGAPVALLTTAGFGDLLTIRNQDRPDLFALDIVKPTPLYQRVFEIEERLAANGTILQPLNETAVRNALETAQDDGIESIAIAYINSYRNAVHEERTEHIAREFGFEFVSRSSAIAPTIKMVPRAETAVLDAYLSPIIREYIGTIQQQLGAASPLKLMTSHGGLIDASAFFGKDSILSGPAGGVIAFSQEAVRAGFERSIGFDMGGTSTDVARFAGQLELSHETVTAGVNIASPMLAIETVAAGGGSICRFDGVQLQVGPESAGADPGPACYGRGGPLTVTDMNVVLGRLLPERFPFPLDVDAVVAQLENLCIAIENSPFGTAYTPTELARGFLDIANETMARAIRRISIQKGISPADHALVTFGGAGGQHACAMARSLKMKTVLIHPYSSLMSAYGMGLANIRRRAEESILEPWSANLSQRLSAVFDRIETQLRAEVSKEGIQADDIALSQRTLSMRYVGLEASIEIDSPHDRNFVAAYEREHESLFGFRMEGRAVEVVAARVEVSGHLPSLLLGELSTATSPPESTMVTECQYAGKQLSTPVYDQSELLAGHQLTGPALICSPGATVWLEPGFACDVMPSGNLQLTMASEEEQTGFIEHVAVESKRESDDEIDPITLEIFNNRFASIAEQMGETLQRTSVSTNVKERLDYSCALFDADANLIVNAPHIPVHLGAMSETVRCLLQAQPDMSPGDVYVTNDPFAGGSHLPDVTVVTPVFEDGTNRLLFLTASRAHHAEIGGITPGSMPPFSKTLADEGILLRHMKLIDGGESRMDTLKEMLMDGPFPSRSPEDNLSDTTAQIAANQLGARMLMELVEEQSVARVLAAMASIRSAAEQKMRRALRTMEDGSNRFEDQLDDGAPIVVTVTIDGDEATVDFTGTGPVLESNLNANRAIVTAAVMYVFRCLMTESIPLNSGVMEPLTIVLPESLLNPPAHDDPHQCAAMVGGNVETSQRVVDVLLGALGIAAASQGTMNNLTFGNGTFGYYETICGGAGATAQSPGADAVHTHMTNTRLTDVEVVEHRYPCRIREFRIRRGSGGSGRHPGGNGIVRTFEFLEPLDVSLLTQRRTTAPFGMNNGNPGQPGRNLLIRADGNTTELDPSAHIHVQPGDQLTIKTPGGGGYGSGDETDPETARFRSINTRAEQRS